MIIEFESIKAFEELYNTRSSYVIHQCKCGGLREMILGECMVKIGDKIIYLNECPILVCKNCGDRKIGNLMPQGIYDCYWDMDRKSATQCRLTALNKKRFKYAESMDLKYDCRDLNIPGLDVDLDPFHEEGFSCPVFFDKKVLNNFLLDDEYEMDLVSETQGYIAKHCDSGWSWEWHIDFGLNSNGKVVIFLGDLEYLTDDEKAILWLKSYNVQSDHTMVESELYQSQFLNQFSDLILEQRLIELRNSFFSKVLDKHKIDLFHLQDEFEKSSKELTKPINYTKQEIKNNIVLLDNLLNDAINCDRLRELYEKCVNPPAKSYKQYKSIKLLLGILTMQLPEEDSNKILSPLFNLKDLRDCFSHILPHEKIEPLKQRIIDSYHLNSFEEYEKLYNTLIARLYDLFKYLNIAEI